MVRLPGATEKRDAFSMFGRLRFCDADHGWPSVPGNSRQDPILRDIPVVVVSGNPPLPQLPKGIEAYLTKPVNVDRLIDV